jgi:hypothetical protein
MAAIELLQNFTHLIDLNLLGYCQIIGLTNNPVNMTFEKLRKGLKKCKIKITNTKGEEIDLNDIRFRLSIKDYIENDKHNIPFTDPIVKVDGVIATDIGYFPSFQNLHVSPNIEQYRLESSSESFNIFVRDSTSFQVSVTSNTKIGYIAKVVNEKLGYPIGIFRLIANGRSLNFDKTIDDYKIEKDMNIYVTLSLKGGMFHVTSGRSGNYDNSGIIFINMDDV